MARSHCRALSGTYTDITVGVGKKLKGRGGGGGRGTDGSIRLTFVEKPPSRGGKNNELTVYGGGEEPEGPFTLAGTLDLDTRKLRCVKTIWRMQPAADVKPTTTASTTRMRGRQRKDSRDTSALDDEADDEAGATVGPHDGNVKMRKTKRKRGLSASLSASSSMSPGTLRGC